MSYIAFDLGGSGGKVYLGSFCNNKIEIKEVHRFENAPVDINGGLYWDIVKIYTELKAGIKKAAAVSDEKIVSLGIDCFSNDFAFVDKKGELLTPVRCYRDERTVKYEKEIYAKMSKERLYELTGNQIAPFNTLMQLAAMIEAGQKFILDNAYKMLFVPDLLINFLTGEFAAEYTVSSVSQMYSFEKDSFDEEILSAYGIRKELFAPISKSGNVVGKIKKEIADELESDEFSVVSVCEHDTGSAFLGAVEKDSVIISSGTWSLVGTEAEKPVINKFGYENNFANEGGYEGHHRILHNVMGSWLLQQIRAYYREKGTELTYPQMCEAARQATPFKYLIDVDDLIFFAPGNMPEKIKTKCREVYGSCPENLGELVRCVSESLAMKYRWVVENLEALVGKKLGCVNVIGGGCQDELLCEFTANACGRRVVAGPSEATSIGNIMVQMIANGDIKDIEEGREILKSSMEFKTYIPTEKEKWEEEYKKFKQMYIK